MRLTIVRSPVKGLSQRADLPPSRRESDQGCRRRPKTKYEFGATPAELTKCAGCSRHPFSSRIWLAGPRLMSMSAAAHRAPLATAGHRGSSLDAAAKG